MSHGMELAGEKIASCQVKRASHAGYYSLYFVNLIIYDDEKMPVILDANFD